MSSVTLYTCDECGEKIDNQPKGYGPLVLELSAPQFMHVGFRGELCGIDCARKWLEKSLKKLV